MMMVTATNFVYVTLCVYSACRTLLLAGSYMRLAALNTLGWAFVYGFIMYLIVHLGHFSRREVKFKFLTQSLLKFFLKALKTAKFIHKIANVDHLSLLSERIMMFSQQLAHTTPSFSCGLFDFDLSLAFKVTHLICKKPLKNRINFKK